MYSGNICRLLSEAKRVTHFSAIDSLYDEDKKEWTTTIIMNIVLYKYKVFATRNTDRSNLILLSTDDLIMDDLYHLCHLVNYDVNYEKFGAFCALELIGANGGSEITNVNCRSLFIHVDGKNPDHYFDK